MVDDAPSIPKSCCEAQPECSTEIRSTCDWKSRSSASNSRNRSVKRGQLSTLPTPLPQREGRLTPGSPLSVSATRPSSSTAPPPPTSPSASPHCRCGCRMMRLPQPSIACTSPAIPTPQGKLPTSSARWRRRDHGHNARHIPVADTRSCLPALPAASVSSGPAPSRRGETLCNPDG